MVPVPVHIACRYRRQRGGVALLAYQTTGSAGLTAAVAGLGALPYLLFGLLTGAALLGITICQQLTPDELPGRVNTTGRMIAWGGAPFGALIGGVVAEAAGLRAAYLVLAVPLLVGLAVLLTSPVRTYHADPSML